jgi:hypothetical protein
MNDFYFLNYQFPKSLLHFLIIKLNRLNNLYTSSIQKSTNVKERRSSGVM